MILLVDVDGQTARHETRSCWRTELVSVKPVQLQPFDRKFVDVRCDWLVVMKANIGVADWVEGRVGGKGRGGKEVLNGQNEH